MDEDRNDARNRGHRDRANTGDRAPIAALSTEGALVLAGLTPEPIIIGDSLGFRFQGNQIRGHYGSGPEHVEELIGLAAAGRIDLAPSITAHVPPADAADAVARLEKKIGDPVRLVLTP